MRGINTPLIFDYLPIYNNKPAPKDENEIILPNHIRIFLDQPLLDVLAAKNQTQIPPEDSPNSQISQSPQLPRDLQDKEKQQTHAYQQNSQDQLHEPQNLRDSQNPQEPRSASTPPSRLQHHDVATTDLQGDEFFKEAVAKGRSVCWSRKGLKDNEEVEDKWKWNNGYSCVTISSDTGDNIDPEEALQDDSSDSHEVTTWGDAVGILMNCSVVIGLHPDQATEAIVDFALERRKPFAIIPCCVYHKEFPKRRFPDGTPISKYEDFVEYLINKDPTNIHKTMLDIEGKNTILYYHPQT